MTDDKIRLQLEQRLGKVHARIRMGLEADSGHKIFGHGINFFHPENWYSSHKFIKACLKLSGFYNRGVRNARNIQVRHNKFYLSHLPSAFENFTLLHLTDLHTDMDTTATQAIADTIKNLDYDVCLLTGDYRARTFGEHNRSMECMRVITDKLHKPGYGVLGNHDSIYMVPELESQGIQMLLNESISLQRNNQSICIAGIDDAHYFRANNLENAATNIPEGIVSILLSHTPEVYREACYAGFDIMLSGHTHGGQICLPGGIPLTLDSRCPRALGAGHWQYKDLNGYTSVGAGTSIVNVRINCLPEVTLHTLHQGTAG